MQSEAIDQKTKMGGKDGGLQERPSNGVGLLAKKKSLPSCENK